MRVEKRNGTFEDVQLDKITLRLRQQAVGLNVDCVIVAINTVDAIYDGIRTSQLDIISARRAEVMNTVHPDYSILASRILISNLYKSTPDTFSECIKALGPERWKPTLYKLMISGVFDKYIDHSYDMSLNYAGFLILENTYLEKHENVVCDRYQYMLMRSAIATAPGITKIEGEIPPETIAFIVKSYRLLADRYYTNATPTLINACKHKMQMISCFLYGTDDSAEDIMRTASNTALVSKWAGGIGIHMNEIRSCGQHIKSTGGRASGLPKQLKIYNSVVLAFDQGGRRKGAMACYVEPWHGDIMEILQLKTPQGDESARTRDLFFGLWIPDLLFDKWIANDVWHLFSNDTAPGLANVYDNMEVCPQCNYCVNDAYNKYITPCINKCGRCTDKQDVPAFTILYNRYVSQNLQVRTVKASTLIAAINKMQRDAGGPYNLSKDAANCMSNQKNVGTIKSSNLCAEIIQHSSSDEYSSCCLASINLSRCVDNPYTSEVSINYDQLHLVAEHVAEVLDNVIDNNDYPVPECVEHAQRLRPIGIGIQGLADVFCKLRVPFESPAAAVVDIQCAETIYHGALTRSIQLAEIRGKYAGFDGSPASEGILKLDMWRKFQQRKASKLGVTPIDVATTYDWDIMRVAMRRGTRNSLLAAYMPTASTAPLMGNNESFEPYHSNLYTKDTIGPKYVVMNVHMVRHLIELGIWNISVETQIREHEGTIQHIVEIPAEIRAIYKTGFEIKQSTLMQRATLRSAFVDQSQSLNILLNSNDDATLQGVMMTGYRLGLITSSYYIRTQPATSALKNTRVVPQLLPAEEKQNETCPIGCFSCGS